MIKNRLAEHLATKSRDDGRKYTRRDIAEELGVARGTIDSYMRNETVRYDMRIVAKLCTWLGIKVEEFFILIDNDIVPSSEKGNRMPIPA